MTAESRHNTALWAGILVGPIIWLTSFITNFALAPWACAFRWKPALFVVSAIALLITASSGFLAWREWRRVGVAPAGEAGGLVPRSRAMAMGGVLLSGIFVLIIIAQVIVESVLGACD